MLDSQVMGLATPFETGTLATWVLGISTVLQFVAAGLAIRLVRFTGLFWPSISLSAAVALMGIRRSVTLTRALGEGGATPDLAAESVALLISVCMVVGIATVTRQLFMGRRAEQIRQLAEEKFRVLAELVDEPCLLHDIRGRLVGVNDAAARALGYDPQQLVDLEMENLEPGWSRERIRDFVRPRADPADRGQERTFRRGDGSSLVAPVRGRLVGGGPEQLVLTVLGI
jgi:PAS domain S-box-containing protein